jgi:predicted acyl esterase
VISASAASGAQPPEPSFGSGTAPVVEKPKYPNFPSETPSSVVRPTAGADFDRREVMIAMRDGVKLHTIILVPHGAQRAAILLTRTPYEAKKMTALTQSLHLGARLWGYDNPVETIVEGGYIRVVQDIRGKYGSRRRWMSRPTPTTRLIGW